MNKFIVITSINPKTKAIREFESLNDWTILIVGDRKSANIKSSGQTEFLSLSQQQHLSYKYARACPTDHYSRKNIGYLHAIGNGARIIYDTDDDNFPKENWALPPFECLLAIDGTKTFVNIYKYFSKEKVWPRGFPLDEINWDTTETGVTKDSGRVGIWQGLADGDPDVDAIFRLVDGQEIIFESKPPVFLHAKTYCPINSQNTFWCEELFPLLYLPAKVSFRFTDILRGYIAQRLCWHHGYRIGFTEATVFQQRMFMI